MHAFGVTRTRIARLKKQKFAASSEKIEREIARFRKSRVRRGNAPLEPFPILPTCEKIVQAPAPSRPIPRSMAEPNLLAYVLTSRFDDHVPLYRQNEIFTRIPGNTSKRAPVFCKPMTIPASRICTSAVRMAARNSARRRAE